MLRKESNHAPARINSVDMEPTFKTVWLDGFAARLMQLQPKMNAAVAALRAAATYSEARNLSPKEAAEIFALEEQPGEAGLPE